MTSDVVATPRIGTWLMLVHGAGLLERLAAVGLDFVRLDMEHTPIDADDVARLVDEARDLPIDICLRPASARYRDLERALKTGARRLYVPQIETAAAARSVVEAVDRILPTGERAHISVMLESAEAFRNREGIAAVEGVDLIAMGPADLAQDLGFYGQPDENTLLDPYRYLLSDVAARHGKQWEMGVWTEDAARHWAAEGCPVLTYMTDTSALRACYAPVLAEMSALMRETGP